MKITWLGQAGLLLETGENTIIIDPYLSNSVEKIQPNNKRKVAIDEHFLEIKPNVVICTHNHLDHLDNETLCHYFRADSEILGLAPNSAWQELRKFGGEKNNYVLFNRGTSWTEGGVLFRAVKAEHSDEYAIGVIIQAEGKTYYVTGDTLYNENIFEDLPEKIDFVFLPINGKGNNMNMADAKRFCRKLGVKAIPVHWGMFDEVNARDFGYENKIIPKIYKEIEL